MDRVRVLVERTHIPKRLLSEIRHEARMLVLRWNHALNPAIMRKRRALGRLEEVKLHYGCGSRIFPGWINIDAAWADGIDLRMDLRMPLPFHDGSTRFVFAEHTVEHMDYTRDVPRIFREFHRILEPGGAVRIIVPDLEKYCDALVRRDFEWLRAARPECSSHAEALNNVFYNHLHRRVYDYDTLSQALRQAGFRNIARTGYAVSQFLELRRDLDEPSRAAESLCVEALKE